ncbi:MAG: HEAT repeat domain-containing protein, partial [Aureliella sp.]
MPKPDEIQALLAPFRMAFNESGDDQLEVDDDFDDDFSDDSQLAKRYGRAIAKLPKKLKSSAYLLIGHDDTGKPFQSSWQAKPEVLEKQEAKRKQQVQQFEKLSAADRKKVLALFVPACADWVEAAWQWLKTQPYQSSYARKAFRAPGHPAASLDRRMQWLMIFLNQMRSYKPEVVTVPWLAEWAQHALNYGAYAVVPLLATAIDAGSKEGNEAFDILLKTVTREHAVGIMGPHVIQTLLAASREEGWTLIEKTFLAAQRQEGLRQAIVDNIDCAHPQAFVRMLRLILDNDLLRFSSVARAVDVWLGLGWDSASTKVLRENVEAILRFLDSPAERAKALKNSDGETVYRALWAYAYEDALATIPLCRNLLGSKSDEVRFVAVWMLTQLRLKEAEQVKTIALDDSNLQVAMMAATSATGTGLNEGNIEALIGDESDGPKSPHGTFEALERLYQRLPEKPQTLKPIVWPWTERKVDRSMVAGALLRELGDLPPTRMLPYMKGLNPWAQQGIIAQLAAQKKWDALTRSTLFELVGHASADVRGAAFSALEKQKLKPDERLIIEGYLSRTAADLRKGCIKMLLSAGDADALASAERLASAGDRNRRLAGLEIYRQLAEANRSRSACQERAQRYRAQQKKLTKDEESQLAAIESSDHEIVTLENGLGLFDPNGRTKVATPKKKKVALVTKAAVACIESLDALIVEHRATSVRLHTYRRHEDKLLGEVHSWELPHIDLKKPLAKQWAKFPLAEVWDKWKASRPAALKDKDGLELLRAMQLASLVEGYQFVAAQKWLKKDAKNAKLAKEIVGEFSIGPTKQLRIVDRILTWLFYLEIPGGCIDYLLDCAENALASLPETVIQTAIPKPEPEKKTPRRPWDDEDEKDWRSNQLLMFWMVALRLYLNSTGAKTTPEQDARRWKLERFLDEPCAGASRRRLNFLRHASAFEAGLANRNDVLDCLIGPETGEYGRFSELNNATARPLSKEMQTIFERNPELSAMVDEVRERIFEIEI